MATKRRSPFLSRTAPTRTSTCGSRCRSRPWRLSTAKRSARTCTRSTIDFPRTSTHFMCPEFGCRRHISRLSTTRSSSSRRCTHIRPRTRLPGAKRRRGDTQSERRDRWAGCIDRRQSPCSGPRVVRHHEASVMNEYIDISFRKPNGQRLRVKRQVTGGIEFEERDPIERTVGFQFNARSAVTDMRMRRIAQVKGWDPGQFKLIPSVEDGNIVLRGVDQDALPEGNYELRVEIEEAETSQGT